jgi:hypothetical protein
MNNLSSVLLLLLLLLLCSTVFSALSAELSGGNIKVYAFNCLASPRYSNYSSVIIRANRIRNSQSAIEPNIITNIWNAKQAGLSVDIYIDICRSVDARDLVDNIYSTIVASRTTYATFWVKVVTNKVAGCGWDGYSQQ